jgi:hypothetical protein
MQVVPFKKPEPAENEDDKLMREYCKKALKNFYKMVLKGEVTGLAIIGTNGDDTMAVLAGQAYLTDINMGLDLLKHGIINGVGN